MYYYIFLGISVILHSFFRFIERYVGTTCYLLLLLLFSLTLISLVHAFIGHTSSWHIGVLVSYTLRDDAALRLFIEIRRISRLFAPLLVPRCATFHRSVSLVQHSHDHRDHSKRAMRARAHSEHTIEETVG